MTQNENVRSVKDALEQLVCKESLQGYTCTKSKLEVWPCLHLLCNIISKVTTFVRAHECDSEVKFCSFWQMFCRCDVRSLGIQF